MKRLSSHVSDWLYSLSFLTFLLGSSLAHIENGSELSLWLMAFAFVLSASTTLFPLFGISWLRAPRETELWKRTIINLLQITSWLSFSYAMFLRLHRDMPSFKLWITVTTLFWATWILALFYTTNRNA